MITMFSKFPAPSRRRPLSMLMGLGAVLLFAVVPGQAGSAYGGEGKAADEKKATEAAKDATRKMDEIAEAGRLIQGPAGQPECVWTGRRIVSLLWRDDLDTAARHRELYERFGCPQPHIQDAFRCVVRQGEIDPKSPETLNERVHACWVNPLIEPSPPPAAVATQGSPPATAPQ
jgi:hypothetical protein